MLCSTKILKFLPFMNISLNFFVGYKLRNSYLNIKICLNFTRLNINITNLYSNLNLKLYF